MEDKDKIILGLLGRLSKYYGVDPSLIRISISILALTTGIFWTFVSLYLIGSFIMFLNDKEL